MIKGIGIDIVEIDRVERIIERQPRFVSRVFTNLEQQYCQNKTRPAVHYALRFAAKEALLKALGTGFRGVKWTDIEIDHDDLGKPFINLSNAASQVAASKEIDRIHLSLSFDRLNAVAVVLVEDKE